jgi:predicted acyl esterase
MTRHKSRLLVTCLILHAVFTSVAAAQGPASAKRSDKKPDVQKTSVMVPMHDGVRLATDIYRPASQTGPLPVIFSRGPYGKGAAAAAAGVACKRGYVFISQDMRGRYKSEGKDYPIFHNDGWGERRDGQDSLEWIARQPWCDGSIGTIGGSALGITQTMMAPGAPSTLKAQYIQVAFDDMYSQGTYEGGVWRKSLIETWLAATQLDPKNLELFLKHARYDEFWADTNAKAHADRVNVPAIFWGGWYDIFEQGTIDSFVTIHNHGGPLARGKCRLLIGPYAHGPVTGLTYPENSRHEPKAADGSRFFDYHLKGIANGVDRDRPVNYYVMGDTSDSHAPGNEWRAADNWPPPARPTPFYFHAGGRLTTERPAGPDDRQSFKYNPQKPVLTLGGQNLFGPKGPADLRPTEARNDVLVFTTDVLKEPVEVTGRILAELAISSDCPDTDFTVLLADGYPDGRSMLVTDGILRARFRKSFEREEFLEPSKTYDLTVDLWSTSLVFNKGHRIRVLVSSSNAPRFDPNPNTGHAFRADKETRVATNTIHLSAGHSSRIVLPIIDESLRKASTQPVAGAEEPRTK